ncbi:hypothetical protein GWI33_008011 [Rhynchophorus ferrugineus]|uniref:Uncharacterized protein n=1 Tax=Rhynchophorus ferrugineus TaxID=354439 RepID=A0A834IDE2_RHYFE|nr:hypothetical protein GWI33_008011 [Rhynchophorus ferrugineus]
MRDEKTKNRSKEKKQQGRKSSLLKEKESRLDQEYMKSRELENRRLFELLKEAEGEIQYCVLNKIFSRHGDAYAGAPPSPGPISESPYNSEEESAMHNPQLVDMTDFQLEVNLLKGKLHEQNEISASI